MAIGAELGLLCSSSRYQSNGRCYRSFPTTVAQEREPVINLVSFGGYNGDDTESLSIKTVEVLSLTFWSFEQYEVESMPTLYLAPCPECYKMEGNDLSLASISRMG